MTNFFIASTGYPSIALKRWFWILLLLNIIFILGSRYYLRPLHTGEIIQFEIAKKVAVAKTIVEEWNIPNENKLKKAIQAIYLDYLFIALYVSGLSVASIYVSRLTGNQILKRAGRFFEYLLMTAGVCDVFENIAMWYSLHGRLNGWNVMVAYNMAVIKFSVIILALLFIVISLIFSLKKIGK